MNATEENKNQVTDELALGEVKTIKSKRQLAYLLVVLGVFVIIGPVASFFILGSATRHIYWHRCTDLLLIIAGAYIVIQAYRRLKALRKTEQGDGPQLP